MSYYSYIMYTDKKTGKRKIVGFFNSTTYSMFEKIYCILRTQEKYFGYGAIERLRFTTTPYNVQVLNDDKKIIFKHNYISSPLQKQLIQLMKVTDDKKQ